MKNISTSVIIPTYNRAELLSRAIRSVLAQTYQNWELILLDDGSTDDTTEIVNAYHDSRIRYFYGENHGAACARNRALEKANGQYIAFLDSDDTWSHEKLELQLGVMEKYPQIDLLFTDFQNINFASGEHGTGFDQNAQAMAVLQTEKIDNSLSLVTGGMPQALAMGNFIATDTVLLRKEVLRRTRVFREDLRNAEDFELWWRMGLVGINFAYLDMVLMQRNKPTGSLSSPGVETAQNTLKALDLCKENSMAAGRPDHLPYLNRQYRNTWQNLISAYGKQGDLKLVVSAFRESIKFGFRPGSIRLLLEAFFNALTGKHEH